jgi:hypothetical protein
MREKVISLRALTNPSLTMHGVLVAENALHWVIEEVYDDSLKPKYPRGQRLLNMSKSGWAAYAYVDREVT